MKWIVLDFGTHEIKALKLSMDANKFEILDFAEWPSRADYFKGLGFPDSSAWAAVTIALNENDWLKPEEEVIVTAALPSAYLETRYLKFPFKNEKKIEKVLTFELESTLPFDVEDVLTRHRILEGDGVNESRKETVAMVFCYKREQIKTFEAELRKFQLSNPPITTEILALSSLRQAITQDSVFGILDLGHSKSHFLLMQKSGGILGARTFWWGGEKIIQSVASDASMDYSKAEESFWQFDPSTDSLQIAPSIEKSLSSFTLELRQTLKGYTANHLNLPEPLPIYVLGGLSRVPTLLQHLERGIHSDLPVSLRSFPLENLFGKVIGGAQKLQDPDKAIMTLAIAMSQLRQHRGKIPTFSESGFQFQQNLRKLKTSSFSLLKKVALILIAPFLYSILQFWVQERESKVIVTNLNDTLERVGLKVGNSKSTEDILQQLKKERALNRQKIDQLSEDETSPLVILTEISRRLPNSVKIDVKDFKVTSNIISVTAETTSADAATAITKALQETYPQIKAGAVTTCTGKENCRSFTFEIEREKDS